jgi:hypothetical protein
MSTCSTDCPGALAISSDVTIALGAELEGGGGAAATGSFLWAHPEPNPMKKPTGRSVRRENEVIRVHQALEVRVPCDVLIYVANA